MRSIHLLAIQLHTLLDINTIGNVVNEKLKRNDKPKGERQFRQKLGPLKKDHYRMENFITFRSTALPAATSLLFMTFAVLYAES
ncbi:hypothetical protein [Cyclobacterium plantarum]|uniref:Uncharacterized protein n=1 Tax=Cyclobacterium plantarum TaxID=2716263 RepID=A0ABX0H8C7_9BACT|nr:hypothetical protein [Cyclobacterium plantarum]NHE56476.1 hypothetical protein [Cyclobacterium plantarum]